jgi:thiamine biosynthesis lipoprotein
MDLPADTCDILGLALEGARRSEGLFDPTWAALRDLWRFGDGQDGEVPADEALARRCPLVDYRLVEVEPVAGACRARLPRAGMRVGLGGIAKGWAVDRAAAALRALGHRDFLVQAGGDLYAAGRRGGRPWRVGVRDPRGPPDRAFAWMDLSDVAFSTSGDYERYFLRDGRRHHHLIDPRTCRPAPASRAVTVLARSAVEAEVLSKAAFIRGGASGLRWVERQGGAALLVTSRNRVLASTSMGKRLRLGRPTP